MINFSFTITPLLRSELTKIEETRNKILVELISREEELTLRFEANLDRVTFSSRLTDKKLKRQEALDIINPFDKDKTTTDPENAGYVKAFEWINQKWFMNNHKVETNDIKKIYGFFPKRIQIDETQLRTTLDFIQINPEHPVVQAGIVFILFSQALPNDDKNIKLSLIASNIFLYKRGYDFRGLLDIEEFLTSDLDHFRQLLDHAKQDRNLSSFLEYFTQAVSISAETALKKIKEREIKHDLPAYYYALTERQKEILTLFAKPNVKITNRTVQNAFKISQITASRDLSKLYSLGLIFSAGKGRSVYYTSI